MSLWPHLLAFAAVFALDWLFAFYTRRVAQGDALPAGLYAAGLYSMTGLATYLVANDLWVLPAACAGAFVGTWLSVRKDSGAAGAG